MTAANILAHLQEGQRQGWHHMFGDVEIPEPIFQFDMPVEEWSYFDEFWGFDDLGRKLNARYGTNLTDAQWLSVETVRDVCELLATQARAPIIKPLNLLGLQCKAGAIFLYLIDRLRENGIDVSQIAPSSPLVSDSQHAKWIIADEAAKIAPGKLPPAAKYESDARDALDS